MSTSPLEAVNARYAAGLLAAAQNHLAPSVVLAEPGRTPTADQLVVYPSAMASPALLAELPLRSYQDLKNSPASPVGTSDIALWLQPMQAGIGTSIARTRYLATMLGCPLHEVNLGAKGSDLFVEVEIDGTPQRVSLAEVQILRAIHLAETACYGEVIYSDLVSDKTAPALAALWQKTRLANRNIGDTTKTYAEFFATHPRLRYWQQAAQEAIPARDAAGNPLAEFSAPAGHGFFGFRALLAAIDPQYRPASELPLVAMIGNGEDCSPKPLAAISRWMVDQHIPIAMITTTKTAVDSKGGQIALVPGNHPGQPTYATMVELAQAEQAGQKELFLQLGLRAGDHPAYFNTNIVVLNYQALTPLLVDLYREKGYEEFCRVITPTVMYCCKERRDGEGRTHAYTQLEGALGSVMLTLDRYWREHRGGPLVRFINVDVEERSEFFAPVKSSFDFFRLFYSDCFCFAAHSWEFKPRTLSVTPQCNFGDQAYQDVEFVLSNFRGCHIAGLKKLQVEGLVDFSGTTLAGTVHVANQRDVLVSLREVDELQGFYQGGRLQLRDVGIILPREGGRVIVVAPPPRYADLLMHP